MLTLLIGKGSSDGMSEDIGCAINFMVANVLSSDSTISTLSFSSPSLGRGKLPLRLVGCSLPVTSYKTSIGCQGIQIAVNN